MEFFCFNYLFIGPDYRAISDASNNEKTKWGFGLCKMDRIIEKSEFQGRGHWRYRHSLPFNFR